MGLRKAWKWYKAVKKKEVSVLWYLCLIFLFSVFYFLLSGMYMVSQFVNTRWRFQRSHILNKACIVCTLTIDRRIAEYRILIYLESWNMKILIVFVFLLFRKHHNVDAINIWKVEYLFFWANRWWCFVFFCFLCKMLFIMCNFHVI